VPLLAEHFLRKYGEHHRRPARRLSAGVLDRLEKHAWRGNVRELEHVIEMMVLFTDGDTITEEDLPRPFRKAPASAPRAEGLSFAEAVAEFEKRLLSEAITQAGGVKAEAARRLGLDANQIKYLSRKYGL